MKSQYAVDNYKKIQVNTLDSLKLIIMLYESAIDNLNHAIEYIQTGDIEKRNAQCKFVSRIITELNVALDFEKGGDIALNLSRIYNYVNRKIAKANARNVADPLKEIIFLLSELKEAWQACENIQFQQLNQVQPQLEENKMQISLTG